ncbi:hypothetical protein [Acidobacterium sp. S8]|uniref:hypothetical protein n=1 Tax=Acidobacterium sp. S8 TaxID=1641854 RepID=UPI00131CD7C4|nr:hypothetical protein [Acidobacterium sp. S8]
MIAGVKRSTESLLFATGPFVVLRQTRGAEIRALINKLRPLDCGFDLIRIGGNGDGGYLVPNDLEGIEYCFSPGVSVIANFENQLADRKIHSFLADYSVEAPPIDRPEFTFEKKFLGASDGERFITLSSWKNKYLKDYGKDLLLQMDIESSEYAVVLSTPEELLDQFRIMIIEFHSLEKMFDPFAFNLISSTFDKLLNLFHVVHIHPNNFSGQFRRGDLVVPRNMEFTLLNKKRVRSTKPQLRFPHPLDVDNVPRRTLVLPKCWYSGSTRD